MFLSICHWCHAMAHESFEDTEIPTYVVLSHRMSHFHPLKVPQALLFQGVAAFLLCHMHTSFPSAGALPWRSQKNAAGKEETFRQPKEEYSRCAYPCRKQRLQACVLQREGPITWRLPPRGR